jgi:hypothetical protein
MKDFRIVSVLLVTAVSTTGIVAEAAPLPTYYMVSLR